VTIVPDVSLGVCAATPSGDGASRYLDAAYGPTASARGSLHPEGMPRLGVFLAVDYRHMWYAASKYDGRPYADEVDVGLGAAWSFGDTVRHGPELKVAYFTSFLRRPDAYLGPRSDTFHAAVVDLGYSVTFAAPFTVVVGGGLIVGHEDAQTPLYSGHISLRHRWDPT